MSDTVGFFVEEMASLHFIEETLLELLLGERETPNEQEDSGRVLRVRRWELRSSGRVEGSL